MGSLIVDPPRPIIAGEPIVFYSAELPDGEACQNFSTFIEAIREHVKEEEGSAFGIPIMRAQVDVNSPERYMKMFQDKKLEI